MALAGKLLLPDLQTDRQKESWGQIREAVRKAAHAVRAPVGIGRSAQKRKTEAAGHPGGFGSSQTAPANRTETAAPLRDQSRCVRARRERKREEPLEKEMQRPL